MGFGGKSSELYPLFYDVPILSQNSLNMFFAVSFSDPSSPDPFFLNTGAKYVTMRWPVTF